jgi:hypothetical protein
VAGRENEKQHEPRDARRQVIGPRRVPVGLGVSQPEAGEKRQERQKPPIPEAKELEKRHDGGRDEKAGKAHAGTTSTSTS